MDNQFAGSGLTAAAFSSQTKDFPLTDGKGNSVHGFDDLHLVTQAQRCQKTPLDGKVFLEILNFQYTLIRL